MKTLRLHHFCAALAALALLIAHAAITAEPAENIAQSVSTSTNHPPFAIPFSLKEPGLVTLVIEDESGKRVRNLIAEVPFPAGDNVAYWDGLDDLGRDPEAARHGVYQIPARFVDLGTYRVRGLVHAPVHLRYEFAAYNPGNPPWETENSRGGWLANHTPPSAVLYVPQADADVSPAAPSPGGVILAGSYVSEGGHGLAWLDLDGRKRFGQMWVGGVWTGASHLARDRGSKRVTGVYAYTGAVWKGGGYDGPKPELRLAELLTREARASAPRDRRFGKGWDRPLLAPNAPYSGILPSGKDKPTLEGDFRYTFPDNDHVGLGGLAVHNGLLAASLPKMNQLLWIDAAKRKILGTTELKEPRGCIFDAEGRLLVLTGTQLLRWEIEEGRVRRPAEPLSPSPSDGERAGVRGLPSSSSTVLVKDGLEDPQGITLDDEGQIYVSDWGKSHQVKVFSPTGKLVRTVGKPGAPAAGRYNSSHMNHPKGLTVDNRNQLWVAEEDLQPKRISVWSLKGKFVGDFRGPAEYGGGGRIDPQDKTRFYYHGMEFKLDWKRGTDELVSVFHRPGPGEMKELDGYAGGKPELPLYAHGRQYMANCYNSNPTHGAPASMLWLMQNHRTRPVAALGNAHSWSLLKTNIFKSRWPAGANLNADVWKNPCMFAWSDLNGNEQVEPEEVTFSKAQPGGVTVMPDLSFVVSRVDKQVTRYAPQKFLRNGVPVYELTRGELLLSDAQPPTSSGGDQALVSPDGWTVVTLGIKPFAAQSLCGGKDGRARWSYPSLWPGLHASHESPAPKMPGMVIGTTRLLGGIVTPREGEGGPLWVVNGNMGNMYLFTADGLFVSELFKDVRAGKSLTVPEAKRGMLLDEFSLHDENFWPTVTHTKDGNIYIVDGARTCIVRLDGLESIRRLPLKSIDVTAPGMEQAHSWHLLQEAERQKARGSGTLTIFLRTNAPTVDGKLDDWPKTGWVKIDDRGVKAYFNSNSKPYDVDAAICVSGDRLYAAFKTGDANLLKNAGDLIAPFKTGGALDLMLGAQAKGDPARRQPQAGDQRLLVTKTGNKTLAILYQPVVQGPKQPTPFSSPWRTITIDFVKDVSDEVRLAGSDGNYEVSIPLATLGLTPAPGTEIRGDIGILRGNGFQTLQRVYWNNKATGITSDLPSEAELTPHLWGKLQFKAD